MTSREAVIALLSGATLSAADMQSVVRGVMQGDVPDAVIAALLVLLRQKGETIEEIYGAVQAIMEFADKISLDPHAIDTCGTGGDAAGTFNISTIAAILACSAGAKVAKHGNRSVSSKCGSADVLEVLGIQVELPKEKIVEVFKQTRFAFLYAPLYHKAMKRVASVRRDLGVRTIFNMLGPLVNPAGILRQVVGVYDRELTGMFAQVLRQQGAEHCLIVHGETKEGLALDEPSICGATFISELKDGIISNYTVYPEDFGMKRRRLEELRGGNVQENAQLIWQILDRTAPEAKIDASIYAGGFAIYVSGVEPSLERGIARARAELESGRAKQTLEHIIDAYRQVTMATPTT